MNEIRYNLQTNEITSINIPTSIVKGQDDNIKVRLYFDNGEFNYSWDVRNIFKRADGEKSNNISAIPKDGYFELTLRGWMTDVVGELKVATRILLNGAEYKALDQATLIVEEGELPSNDTIEEVQYDGLLGAINEKVAQSQYDSEMPTKVNKSGDTMTGPLEIPNGTESNHAVNKNQLDTKALKPTNIGDNDHDTLYVLEESGVESGVKVGTKATANTVVKRNASGQIYTAEGVNDEQAVNIAQLIRDFYTKLETNGLLSSKVDKIEYHRLVDPTEINKISKIIIDGDRGWALMADGVYRRVISVEEYDELQTKIELLGGSLVYIGTIELTNENVTEQALTDRAEELKDEVLQGFVLKDLDNIEWYYDGTNWNEFGQNYIVLATNSVDGLMPKELFKKLNDLKVNNISVDANGNVKIYASDIEIDSGNNTTVKQALSSLDGAILNHAMKIDNPHEVTASQVGAYDKATVDGKVVNMAKTNVNNNFSVPQSVPSATDPTHAMNKLDVFNALSDYGGVKNLAVPDLTGKEYLGDGEYKLDNIKGVDIFYNVYNGIFTFNGTSTGNTYEPFLSFSVLFGSHSFASYYVSGTVSKSFRFYFREPSNLYTSIINGENGFWNGFMYNGQTELVFNTNSTEPITFDNYKLKLQIEQGSTATPFKPSPIPLIKAVIKGDI